MYVNKVIYMPDNFYKVLNTLVMVNSDYFFLVETGNRLLKTAIIR